ncbi:MAG: hypothetical protein ACJ8GL_07550 [Bacillus sp. (in: firmicutes)]
MEFKKEPMLLTDDLGIVPGSSTSLIPTDNEKQSLKGYVNN